MKRHIMRPVSSPYRVGQIYLVERQGIYQIHGMHDGKRIRVSTKTNDLRHAKQLADDLYEELLSGWRQADRSDGVNWRNIAKSICARHRYHSKARAIPFDIDAWYVHDLMAKAQYRCAVSGIPFAKQASAKIDPDPWAPSIDRIENRHGYIRGNIRIVCLSANLAMNRWGLDVLIRLAHAVSDNASHPKEAECSKVTQN